ncbi:MAG: DUF6760 family protein [Clostridiaceae bacterium]
MWRIFQDLCEEDQHNGDADPHGNLSALRKGDQNPGKFYGGRSIETYPADKIYKEAAFLAYYLHWSHDDIMEMRPFWTGSGGAAAVSGINSRAE